MATSTQRGSALLASLFLALVVSGLCTTLLLTSSANHLVAANERDRDRALHSSKAGLNYGYHLLVSGQLEPLPEGATFDSFDEGVGEPLDGGVFYGTMYDDGGGMVRIVSKGNYRRSNRTTELVLRSEPEVLRFGFIGFNEVNLHIHSEAVEEPLLIHSTVFSNNLVDIAVHASNEAETIGTPIELHGTVVTSGTLDVSTEDGPARVQGNVFAYSVDNDGTIDGDVTFLTSVTPADGLPDVSDAYGTPYDWYLDRSSPDTHVSGSGSVSGGVHRHVVQDGEIFRSSIFSSNGTLLADPDVNVIESLEPPKIDYAAMKAAADENDPTYFTTEFQLLQYLISKKVTEVVDGQTLTTVKVGTPDAPEFLYVADDVNLVLDPQAEHEGGMGIVRADGLHIEGGIYTAGDFTFNGRLWEPSLGETGHPEGYQQLSINATPYCMPAIVAYSEPAYGSIDGWTVADTPPMMALDQATIEVRSHNPRGDDPPAFEGEITINGLTYAEHESHFHRMAPRERLHFRGAQMGFKVHNCDHFDFTYDPDVACTQFVKASPGTAAPTLVSFREVR